MKFKLRSALQEKIRIMSSIGRESTNVLIYLLLLRASICILNIQITLEIN